MKGAAHDEKTLEDYLNEDREAKEDLDSIFSGGDATLEVKGNSFIMTQQTDLSDSERVLTDEQLRDVYANAGTESLAKQVASSYEDKYDLTGVTFVLRMLDETGDVFCEVEYDRDGFVSLNNYTQVAGSSPSGGSASSGGSSSYDDWDTDDNGKADWQDVDTDNDGKVSQEEMEKYLEDWDEEKKD